MGGEDWTQGMEKRLVDTDRYRSGSVDDAQARFGEPLAAFKGGVLKGVWSLWDAIENDWYRDWATVLETDRGCISVDASGGIRLGIWFDDVDFDTPVSFFEEGCDLYELFDLSWKRHEELSFLEGRVLDSFWLRCDRGNHPFALDVDLDGTILCIGGLWDETFPEVMDPGESGTYATGDTTSRAACTRRVAGPCP